MIINNECVCFRLISVSLTDGNITLRGMEELDEKEKLPLASVSSVQVLHMIFVESLALGT